MGALNNMLAAAACAALWTTTSTAGVVPLSNAPLAKHGSRVEFVDAPWMVAFIKQGAIDHVQVSSVEAR